MRDPRGAAVDPSADHPRVVDVSLTDPGFDESEVMSLLRELPTDFLIRFSWAPPDGWSQGRSGPIEDHRTGTQSALRSLDRIAAGLPQTSGRADPAT